MSGETSVRAAIAYEAPRRELAAAFAAATADLVPLTLALTSEIAKLSYPGAVRAREALQLAVARAQLLAESLSDVPMRVEALLLLANMRALAEMMLAIAPVPSSAAIAAAEAGDATAWHREEQAWIGDPLARGLPPCLPLRRGDRSDTRPESPRSLAATSDKAAADPDHAAPPTATPAANKGRT